MISLHALSREAVAQVAHLALPRTQVDFVGDIAEMSDDPDPLIRMHYASYQTKVIGFFKVDLDISRRIPHLPAGAFGIRGVLVGGQYQGHGYGTAMLNALPDYLRETYPGANEFWLSVDAHNHAARRCYEKSGWVQIGPDRDGRCGKENVMRLSLEE